MNSTVVCPFTNVIHGVFQLSSLIEMHEKCLRGKSKHLFSFMGIQTGGKRKTLPCLINGWNRRSMRICTSFWLSSSIWPCSILVHESLLHVRTWTAIWFWDWFALDSEWEDMIYFNNWATTFQELLHMAED